MFRLSSTLEMIAQISSDIIPPTRMQRPDVVPFISSRFLDASAAGQRKLANLGSVAKHLTEYPALRPSDPRSFPPLKTSGLWQ